MTLSTVESSKSLDSLESSPRTTIVLLSLTVVLGTVQIFLHCFRIIYFKVCKKKTKKKKGLYFSENLPWGLCLHEPFEK